MESSDDEDYWLDALEPIRIRPTYLDRIHPFEQFDELKFKERFRLNKPTVLKILAQIEHKLEFRTDRNRSVSPMNQLLIALRFLATGTFQLIMGDLFGVNKSTICRISHKVISELASLAPNYIIFPQTEIERRDMMKKFYAATGFPGVFGAIDCTHIPIQNPEGNDSEIFLNRKGWFSINTQLICDTDLYIIDAVARWPGSVHDSTILAFSNIRYLFETKQVPEGYLIGDGGYACSPWLLTPLPETPLEEHVNYNVCHIQTRNCIERANGVLKNRFGAFKYGFRIKLERIPSSIIAAVVLHNIGVTLGDDVPSEDKELEYFVKEKRKSNYELENTGDIMPSQAHGYVVATSKRTALISGHFRKV